MSDWKQEKPHDFVSQNGKAKSKLVNQIVRIVRKAGIDYEGWRYVSKRVRQLCELRPATKGRKLPKVLNADDFRHMRPWTGPTTCSTL